MKHFLGSISLRPLLTGMGFTAILAGAGFLLSSIPLIRQIGPSQPLFFWQSFTAISSDTQNEYALASNFQQKNYYGWPLSYSD